MDMEEKMKKPTILLVTKTNKVCKTFEENLRMFFSSKIDIDTCSDISQLNEKVLPNADLIVVTSPALEKTIRTLNATIPVMVARRSIQIEKLEQLMGFPAKTRILLVTNSLEVALDSIDILYAFGFGHLTLMPYVPGFTDIEQAVYN